METTTQHDWQIETEGNKYRAKCSCGWQGLRRIYMADARYEAQDHKAAAQ